MNMRKEYIAPQITQLGSLYSLTQGSLMGMYGDMFGSMAPLPMSPG
jgi:hypothetical protein